MERRERSASEPVAVRRFRNKDLKDQIVGLRNFGSDITQSALTAHAQTLLQDVLERAERLGFQRVTLADACETSTATISRWINGQTAPHPLVARAVIKAVGELALRRAAELGEKRTGQRKVTA
jgi:hypothetical protein